MLIDQYMPRWDVRERHAIAVNAPAERIFDAVRSADLSGHRLTRFLLAARALPAAVTTKNGIHTWRTRRTEPLTLSDFEQHGFRLLAENRPWEVVIALEGKFWRVSGDLRAVSGESFGKAVPGGLARAIWNFSIVADAGARCTLHTETRVLAGDAGARRRLRAYWFLIRPGSGLIRRLMLRAIKEEAERPSPGGDDAAPAPDAQVPARNHGQQQSD